MLFIEKDIDPFFGLTPAWNVTTISFYSLQSVCDASGSSRLLGQQVLAVLTHCQISYSWQRIELGLDINTIFSIDWQQQLMPCTCTVCKNHDPEFLLFSNTALHFPTRGMWRSSALTIKKSRQRQTHNVTSSFLAWISAIYSVMECHISYSVSESVSRFMAKVTYYECRVMTSHNNYINWAVSY